jgi:hypothetical protein
MTMPTRTTIQNWLHTGLTVLAFLSMIFGLVQTAITSLSPGDQARFGPWLALVGGILLAASKAIDSLNSAILGIPPAPPAGPVV